MPSVPGASLAVCFSCHSLALPAVFFFFFFFGANSTVCIHQKCINKSIHGFNRKIIKLLSGSPYVPQSSSRNRNPGHIYCPGLEPEPVFTFVSG